MIACVAGCPGEIGLAKTVATRIKGKDTNKATMHTTCNLYRHKKSAKASSRKGTGSSHWTSLRMRRLRRLFIGNLIEEG
jgi:hypothetical protein